jgi:hypothetical protein
MSDERDAGWALLRIGVAVPVRLMEESVMPGAEEGEFALQRFTFEACDPAKRCLPAPNRLERARALWDAPRSRRPYDLSRKRRK